MSSKHNSPFLVIILDGWGIAPKNRGNAIELANKPNFDFLIKNYPNTTLFAHGKHVGLPHKQVGNSEAGHLNIGGGRVVKQDSVIISKSIKDGTFFKNPAFLYLIKRVNELKSNAHLMGIISQRSSPHMSLDHLYSLIDLTSKKCQNVYLHVFTDGRDSPQFAASGILRTLQQRLPKNVKIASVAGRFYAMDRNKTWQRTKKAYNLLAAGQGPVFDYFDEAIMRSYNKGLTDEFIEPSLIAVNDKKPVTIQNNDGLIFFNLRSDRARQLTKCFVQKEFNKLNPGAFIRKKVLKNVVFVALTDFGPDLD